MGKAISIRYSCQSGSDKNVFERLSDVEQKQLSIIVRKLLNNGVKLQINYTDIKKSD